MIGLISVVNLFHKRKQPVPRHDPRAGNHPPGYHDPDSAHLSSYADSDAVGRSYTDPMWKTALSTGNQLAHYFLDPFNFFSKGEN